jgi:hypothetical protein
VYRVLPPFRLVRAPGRAAFLFLFAASGLLAHGLSYWRSRPYEERRRSLIPYWPAGIAVLVVALFAGLAATGAVFMAVHPTETSGRLWHQIGGFSLALVVVGLGGALIWAYLMADAVKNVKRLGIVSLALIILVTADTWWFAFKMARPASSAAEALWVDGKALVGDAEGRVLPWGVPLFLQNGAMQVDWASVFGYDSLEPAAHIALASSVPDPRSTAYDILGATHVLAGGPLDNYTEGDRPLTLLGQQGAAWVYSRARSLPLARLVYDYEVIAEPAAAIERIHAADFDPATTALLDHDPECAVGPAPSSPGTAEIVTHDPAHWRILTRSDSPALLILAENAYPGWQARIDDQPAEGLTAYTSLRAVCVPGGEHTIEWDYSPTIYMLGGMITLAALGVTVASVFRLRRQGARLIIHP